MRMYVCGVFSSSVYPVRCCIYAFVFIVEMALPQSFLVLNTQLLCLNLDGNEYYTGGAGRHGGRYDVRF